MRKEKIFIGPKLRAFRTERGLTQAELGQAIGVSASYVNLVEKNQRNASLRLLLALSDHFGFDWRHLTKQDNNLNIADLRQITNDPAFGDEKPDIEELRAAVEHAPTLVTGLFQLFRAYGKLNEELAASSEVTGRPDVSSAEEAAHDLFRQNHNYFDILEREAEALRESDSFTYDEAYAALKLRLKEVLGIETRVVPVEILGNALRYFDRHNKRLLLSEGLDHTNKVFQIAHSIALIEHSVKLNEIMSGSAVKEVDAVGRCRVELANYFAAAVMMPYAAFLKEAQACEYDIEFLATKFGVSYEHACHRLTTMQRPGAKGIPFFFLRIDRAGNVTKRFNATPIQLARFGGACPRLDVHFSFRIPGRIFPQYVEMPDGERYFTINRTVDRPALKYTSEDKRLAVSVGCAAEHAAEIIYSRHINMQQPRAVTEIGVNCRLCPRHHCDQRAHLPVIGNLVVDEDRRGITRFES